MPGQALEISLSEDGKQSPPPPRAISLIFIESIYWRNPQNWTIPNMIHHNGILWSYWTVLTNEILSSDTVSCAGGKAVTRRGLLRSSFVNLEKKMQGRKWGTLLLIHALQKWNKYCEDKVVFPLLLFFYANVFFNLPNLSDGHYNYNPTQ
jgi:hypothetical protein